MAHIQAIRGTKDILFPEINLWNMIERTSYETLENANYNEIRIPIFENSNLYTRSLGQVSDVVQKEMYTFKDKGQREVTLRPEGTAGVARAFIEHKLYQKSLPQRFWYCGPMFRYERPQAGRQRQFHQLGLECIGSRDPRVEVEIIALALSILNQLQIPNLTLEINSLGSDSVRTRYKQALFTYLESYISSFDTEVQDRLKKNPLRLLDSKDAKIQDILQNAPSIVDCLDNESETHFNSVCKFLDSLSIKYSINPSLVRGLDYYNDTTFEIKSDVLGAQDTICGGGRYDTLIQSLGGPDVPAAGWAMGMERLLLAMPKIHKINNRTLDCYMIMLGEKAEAYSLIILQELRGLGLKVDISLSHSSLPKQIKKANQLQAITCIIIGEKEIQKEVLILKWLDKREQETIALSQISLISDKVKSYKKNSKQVIPMKETLE
mmetsp:Transcript_19198/g.76943  ORF Transcript_19198/g.76943 Transcript_19198/m.76943 type:complete len:436 (+) Transcript_19198:1248-2555(+)